MTAPRRSSGPSARRAPMAAKYVYLGAKGTDPKWVGQPCNPVLRPDGKCIVGRQGGPRNQLVRFNCGTEVVVSARRLRLTSGRRGAPAPSLVGQSILFVAVIAVLLLGPTLVWGGR